MTWITQQPLPVPATQRKHLVTFRRWQGHPRPGRYHYCITLAIYISRFTELCHDDEFEDIGEYNEADNGYYWPEGWYEICESHPEYIFWKLDGEVVAIQPAPKAWDPVETAMAPVSTTQAPSPKT
jgi:hypothetical protein